MRLVCLLLLASATASAQPADSTEARPRRPAWLSYSVMAGSDLSGKSDQSLLVSTIQFQRPLGSGRVLLQIGVSGSTEFSFLGRSGRSDGIGEVHVAMGTSGSVGPLFLSATAGPSIGFTTRGGSSTASSTQTVPGVFAGVQGVLVILPAFGIGVEAFSQINAVMPVAGVGFNLSFGRLPGAVFPNMTPMPRRAGP